MRIRTWTFAALVALVFAINLALVSLRIAQTGEDTVRSRMALASSALKAQLELLDARLQPRSVAMVPDLIEATRAPPDPTLETAKPDERALRAAASALTPEPDLVAVVNTRGAIVSRRGKPAQQIDDAAQLPQGKAALEGSPPPAFVFWDGAVWRIAASRIPGNAAASLLFLKISSDSPPWAAECRFAAARCRVTAPLCTPYKHWSNFDTTDVRRHQPGTLFVPEKQ